MQLELVHFPTSDGLTLPGLLYTSKRKSDRVAIFLHGNGDASIFYSKRTNLLAEELTRRGIAFFPFNNRGAHLIRWLDRRDDEGEKKTVLAGTVYETIAESVIDVDAAIAEMRRRGFREIHLVGHSSGANKIAVWNRAHPKARVASYTFLAPGDDTGIYYRHLGPTRFRRALDRARTEVARGRGEARSPKWVSPFGLSWQAVLDTLDPDGDYNVFPFLEATSGERIGTKELFAEVRAIRKPLLVVWGSLDPYCNAPVDACAEIIRNETSGHADVQIVDQADHGFHGSERDVGRLIWRFILDR